MLVGFLLVWYWDNGDKIFHPMYYASKDLNEEQKNYIVTEQEQLAVVFAF